MGENNFKGLGVALITPFKNDLTIDYEAIAKIVNFQIENGTNYLVVLGTTGETATLSSVEKKQIFEFIATEVNGRIKLVAGIGGNYTDEVVQTIKNFNSKGYDAILSVAPYYNKPSQAGLYEHYKALNDHSSLPLIMYNVPGRTGMNITTQTTLKIAENCKNIIATKEASGNMEQIMDIIANKPVGFEVISGDDPLTLPLIAAGSIGVISVAGNTYPKEMSEMVQLCLEGNFKTALPIHFKMLPKIAAMFAEGNPSGIKQFMTFKNLCLPNCRLPIVQVGDELKTIIQKLV